MKFIILFAALVGTGLCGSEAGECGCCPEPCCCVCIDQTPPTTTTTSTTTTTTTTTTSTTTPFIPMCNVTQEVAIILDSSGSIGLTDWNIGLQFVSNIVDSFMDIGAGATRVGFITFGTEAILHFALNDPKTMSRQALQNAIAGTKLQGTYTNTPAALELASTQIFNAPGDVPDIPNIAIVITDGRHTHGKDIFLEKANQLKDAAEVIVVGVTSSTVQADLETMATDGSTNVFQVSDFDDLTDILSSIVAKACTEPPIQPPRSTTTKAPRTTRPPTSPRPTPIPSRECFCCCPPPGAINRAPHNTCLSCL